MPKPTDPRVVNPGFDIEKLLQRNSVFRSQSFDKGPPEEFLIDCFLVSLTRYVDPELPFFRPDVDVVHREFAFKHGRADLVISHVDGSYTIIEAKVGDKGYTHVAQGIGQLGMYAAQLMVATRSVVRRALLWSAIDPGADPQADMTIVWACKMSGVIPIGHGHIDNLRNQLVVNKWIRDHAEAC